MTFGMTKMHIARMVTISAIIPFILSTTILAAERNPLEHRTKFIIYDNKYEIINAQKFPALTLQMMPIMAKQQTANAR